jgi:spermidine synthase
LTAVAVGREGSELSKRIEELDWCQTPIGEISLRRRRDPVVDVDVYEVKINDEFLMSSLFTVAEIQLATLGLAELAPTELSVLVGGLGLGYTAAAVLDDPRVTSLTVVEAVAPVIDWHRRRLLPDTAGLAADPRCVLVHGDFFAMVAENPPPQLFDAVLLDIDHTPRNVLHPTHAAFYTRTGLRNLEGLLRPEGVFAMWSDDPPDSDFEASLATVFTVCATHVVEFPNPLTGGTSASTVYVAKGLLAGS